MMHSLHSLTLSIIICCTLSLQAQFGLPVHIADLEDVRVLLPGDFDDDGDLDVLAARPNERRLFLNDGTGDFSTAILLAGNYSLGLFSNLESADLDGDGDLDIISSSAGMIWQRNEGEGVFSEPIQCFTTGDSPLEGSKVEAMDFNNDGLLDLRYGHYLIGEWLLLNPGGDAFPTDFSEAYQIAAGFDFTYAYGDVDMDDYPDMLAVNSNAFNISLLYNSDTDIPNFDEWESVAGYMYVNLTAGLIADLDNDGYGDLIYQLNNQPRVAYAAEDSDYALQLIGEEEVSVVDVIDVNGDGLNDLLARQFNTAINPVTSVVYYENEGGFSFMPLEIVTYPAAVEPSFGDVNGDGHADIILMKPGEIVWYPYVVPEVPVAGFSYFLENGTFSFTDTSLYLPHERHWDFGDGQTSSLSAPTHVYAEAGSYEVCLTVSNWAGSDRTCQTIEWTITNVNDLASARRFTVAPNPAQDQVIISWPDPMPGGSYLQWYDVLGTPIAAPVLIAGQQQLTVDVSTYPPGTYLFKVYDGERSLGYGTLVKLPE